MKRSDLKKNELDILERFEGSNGYAEFSKVVDQAVKSLVNKDFTGDFARMKGMHVKVKSVRGNARQIFEKSEPWPYMPEEQFVVARQSRLQVETGKGLEAYGIFKLYTLYIQR